MSRHHDLIKNDPRYKAWRLAVLDRDDYTCVRCGSTVLVQADHIIPLAVLFAHGATAEARANACDVDNGQALCRDCNQSKGDTVDQIAVRHTWVSPRYPALDWLHDREPIDAESTPVL